MAEPKGESFLETDPSDPVKPIEKTPPIPAAEPSKTSYPTSQKINSRPVAFKDVGKFVMAMVQAPDGAIWVGTEDDGLFRFVPKGKAPEDYHPEKGVWTQYTGLGDDSCYALAFDKLGRLWISTLNHGRRACLRHHHLPDRWRRLDGHECGNFTLFCEE